MCIQLLLCTRNEHAHQLFPHALYLLVLYLSPACLRRSTSLVQPGLRGNRGVMGVVVVLCGGALEVPAAHAPGSLGSLTSALGSKTSSVQKLHINNSSFKKSERD